MNSIRITAALTIAFHFVVSSASQAGTLADGDFSSWVFATTGTATVTREPTAGDPGPRLNITTVSGSQVYGAAIKSDFITNAPFVGDLFSLSLDVLSGPGSFGQGQNILILVEQSGSIYGRSLGVTGFPHNFDTITYTGAFNAAEFTRLLGPGPTTPDFVSGVPTHFGFAGGNSGSGTLTQYYDNFQLDSAAVPEPATTSALICGALCFCSLRRQLRGTRNG